MASRIGEILLQRGLISREQLDRALATQRRWGVRVGVCLVRLGFIEEEALASSLNEQLGIPLAGPTVLDAIPSEVIARVPAQVALNHRLIPIRVEGSLIHVCLADPQNLLRLDDIAFTLGAAVRPYLATENQIERALARYYPGAQKVEIAGETMEMDLDWDVALGAAGQWRIEQRRLAKLPHEGDSPTPERVPPAPPISSPMPERVPAAPPRTATPVESTPPSAVETTPATGGAPNDAASRKQKALLALGRALGAVKNAERDARPEPAPLIDLPEPPPSRPAAAPPTAAPTAPVAPTAPAAPIAAPLASPYAVLAAAMSRQDLAAALRGSFAEIFPTVCVLEIEPQGARCVAFRGPGKAESDCAALARIPFDRAGWITDVIARPPIRVIDQLQDPPLLALLEQVGMAARGLAVAAVVDGGAASHVVLCQGLAEAEVKGLVPRLRPYLLAASDAVRMVALRDQILSRERGEHADRPVSDQASTRHLDFSGACADPRLRSR